MSSRILVVDDDVALAEMIGIVLEAEGYQVFDVYDGAQALDQFHAVAPDLVLLDLMLPGLDGIEICRLIRRESDVPVVMLTARSDTADVVAGLEAGADDYVPKPCTPRELVARIRTVLRRTGGEATTNEGRHADFSGWSLDIAARALTAPDGRLAPLSGADFDLLHALVRNGGKPLSRERIRALSTVADADDRAIDLRVSRLRQKLGDDAKAPALIRTVRSLGYMLAGPVTWRA